MHALKNRIIERADADDHITVEEFNQSYMANARGKKRKDSIKSPPSRLRSHF